MSNVVNVASELGYLNIPDGVLIDINEINDYQDHEIVVITTGSQGEPMSALSRMAASEHKIRNSAWRYGYHFCNPYPGMKTV